MHALDQYILLRAAEVDKDVREHYDNFVFHKVYHRLKDFCIVDLSSIYFDVLKDRLYTSAPKSARAAIGADRAVAAGRGPGAAAGPGDELHLRGSLGIPAR